MQFCSFSIGIHAKGFPCMNGRHSAAVQYSEVLAACDGASSDPVAVGDPVPAAGRPRCWQWGRPRTLPHKGTPVVPGRNGTGIACAW